MKETSTLADTCCSKAFKMAEARKQCFVLTHIKTEKSKSIRELNIELIAGIHLNEKKRLMKGKLGEEEKRASY